MTEVKKMPFETYLAVIENSAGTSMFKNGFARINNQPKDIMKSGELSCAFYVSSVLKIFNLVGSMHATVTSTVNDLEKSGWQKVAEPNPGDVIVWKPLLFPDGERHEHIGFVLGANEAISNDYSSGTPKRHTFKQTPEGSKREIEAVYRGSHLFEPES